MARTLCNKPKFYSDLLNAVTADVSRHQLTTNTNMPPTPEFRSFMVLFLKCCRTRCLTILNIVLALLILNCLRQYRTPVNFYWRFEDQDYLLRARLSVKHFNYLSTRPNLVHIHCRQCFQLAADKGRVRVIELLDGVIEQGCDPSRPYCLNDSAHFDYDLGKRMNTPRCCQLWIIRLYWTLIDLCDKHDIEYWLFGGSLIGLVRYGGRMVPYDDDIDIMIPGDNVDKFMELCLPELDQKGHFLKSISLQQSHLVLSKENGLCIDIFWAVFNGSHFQIPHFNDVYPKQMFSPPARMYFENRLVPVPRDLYGYLDYEYGVDGWKQELQCKKKQGHKCTE